MALGMSLMLAFVVWLIHNLSLDYSALVQRSVEAVCEIDGHSNRSSSAVEVAASCQLSGFSIVGSRIAGRRHPLTLNVSRDEMHHLKGDVFYMTTADLTKHFHDIFSDKSQLEYFVTDTVYFTFNSVEYKKVPVILTYNISYKPQYMAVGGVKVTPDSVLIYGNSDVLETVNAVTTDLVNLKELDADTFGKTPIKQIKGVRMSESKVDYSLNVVRYVQREVQLPVRMLHVPKGVNVKVFPSLAVVRYRMRFPSDIQLNRAYVSVQYSDFVNSINGKCVGEVVGVPSGVISHEISPEVFDCLVQVK